MTIRSFSQLAERLKAAKTQKRVAVVAADDAHTLEAVMLAQKTGGVYPVLIGDEERIRAVMCELQWKQPNAGIAHEPDHEAAAQRAVRMIHAGEADFIMKGRLDTAMLMKIVVNKESELRTGRIMSHLAFLEIPNYPKLLTLSDVALNPAPDLAQKRQIIQNAVEALGRMGVENPKVAVMAAAEEVNPKLAESVDAAELKRMNLAGEITGCVIEGPISYDLAMDREAAAVKGYESPVAGDADLLVMPGLAAGNLLIKGLIFSGGAKSAGFIVGAKVPVVVTSRSSSTEDKYMSIVLAAAACQGK